MEKWDFKKLVWIWAISIMAFLWNNFYEKKKNITIKEKVSEIIDFSKIENKTWLLIEISKLKKTDQKKIYEIIIKIENQINKEENFDKEKIKLYSEKIYEIKKIEKLYNFYLKTPFTNETNSFISEKFKEIFEQEDLFLWISWEIEEKINEEKELLKDNFFWNWPRDIVEKYVSFSNWEWKKSLKFYEWTNFENQEIELFLNLLTIEYLNKIWKENFSDNFLNISKEEAEEIILKVYEKIWEKHKINFKISIKTNFWETEIDFSKENFKKFYLSKNWVLVSKDESIAEIQEKYWLKHINKSIFDSKWKIKYSVQKERINPFLESEKWKLHKKIEKNSEIENLLKTWEIFKVEPNIFFDFWDDLLPYSTLETKVFLEKITKKFYEKTWKKLLVNSLLRTVERNKKLWNSSENSSHLRWDWIDFSRIKLQNKNWEKVNFDEKNQKIFLDILQNEEIIYWNSILIIEDNPPHYHLSITSVNDIFRKNDISKDFLEKENNQKETISNYLERNWLNLSTKVIIHDIFNKSQIDFSKFSEKEKEKIFKNTKTMLNYITFIESSWWNFLENEVSSAKWPFQILHWYKNWERMENYKWQNNFSTFEVWLRKYIKYSNSVEIPEKNLPLTPSFVEKAFNSDWKIWPNELNQLQNINLFLVWSFLWDLEENAESFVKATFLWDFEELEKIYKKHHSNPDEATKKRMLEAKIIFKNDLKK